ncbi:MAG: hypothetical protein RSA66_08280 [Muribaculaceae bacterium]
MKLFEICKCYLRRNKFYKKHCQTHVNNLRYFTRSLRYYFREYSYKKDKDVIGNTLYFIIDPRICHPGLADRLKAIVGSYFIAKKNGFEFKIIFEHPFNLNKYLDQNEIDWVARASDLSYSLKNSRIIPYNGGGKVPHLSKKVKQYHIYSYIGYDILETNNIPNYQHLWGELFRSLFKPTKLLQDSLDLIPLKENEFIAVHIRFVNALEHFEDNEFNIISKEEKEDLIRRCDDAINKIMISNPNSKVVVFSDSQIYLNHAKSRLDVIVLDGKIGHISFSNNEEAVLKTFIDFFTISKSSFTIRLLAPEIYATVFSYYAAISGLKRCEDYFLTETVIKN